MPSSTPARAPVENLSGRSAPFRVRSVIVLWIVALAFLPTTAAAQGGGIRAEPVYDPLEGACENIAACIQNVIKYVLGLAGVIALAGIVYGGFLYLTSAGNQDRVEGGKNALFYSILGLIVIGLAFAIVTFVFTALKGGGTVIAPPS